MPPQADLESGERAPLLQRRSSSRLQDRLDFQREQRQAITNVANNGGGVIIRVISILFWVVFVSLLALFLYVYFGSLWVIVFHLDKPCDKPLGLWLCVWMILPSLTNLIDPPVPEEAGLERERQRRSFRQSILHFSWFCVGYVWMRTAKTCHMTNPSLFTWIEFVIHVYMIFVFIFMVFPVLLGFCCFLAYVFFQYLIERGWLSNPKAARTETIEALETVPYDPSLFAMDESIEDTRPSAECCCCSELFGPELPIVRTPCGHYYHKHCLGNWLKMARTCPLCRLDLDIALGSKDVTAAAGDVNVADSADDTRLPVDTTGSEVEGDEAMARRLQEEELRIANDRA